MPEGQILFQSAVKSTSEVSSLLRLEAGWNAVKVEAKPQDAALFSLEAEPLAPSKELQRQTLGLVLEQSRHVAFTRLEPPWMGPRHGGEFLHFSEPTMFCSILRKDGNVVTVLAPSLDNVYMVLETDDEGRVVVAAKTDCTTDKRLRVLFSVAATIETSIETIMVHLRDEANSSFLVETMTHGSQDLTFSCDMEHLLDNLGFCTWNALGNELTQDSMLGALRDLKKAGVNVSTFLIDDGWHDVGETNLDFSNPQFRGLAHYKAPASKLPDGLDKFIENVKSENPLIDEIGIWHALLGYWGAIAKQGHIANTYETWEIDGKMFYAEPTVLKVVSPKDVQAFYDDFYAYLAASGITFVKTDVQNSVSDIADPSVRSMLIPAYQSAWTLAHQRHLSGRAISCMSQVPEQIFRKLLQTYTPPIVARNSDDFFPEIPSSHTWHVWTNAHNALMGQYLNAVLDWDMFQTSHEFGRFHGASRCLSGGPLLLTDIPGDHDLELINEMVATAPNGRSIALRPKGAGKAAQAWDRIEKGVLRIANETTMGTKLLGVFNVGETDLSMFVSAAEFANIGQRSMERGVEVIVLSHETQKIMGPIKLDNNSPFQSDPRSLIKVDLKTRGCDILSGFKASHLDTPTGDVVVSVLGLLGKMTGAAAVTASEVKVSDGKIVANIKLKALGKFGLWIQGAEVQANGLKTTLEGDKVEANVEDVGEKGLKAQLVTLDLLKAWNRRSEGVSTRQVSLEVLLDL